MRLIAFPPVAFAVVLATLACSGSSSSGAPVDAPAAGQEVSVEVRPRSISVLPGGTVDFTTLVTGTADPTVTWEVIEPDGGTVSATGTYVAPLKAGEYTVGASSRSNPKSRAWGKVKVSATVVTVSPAEVAVPAGGAVAFTATVAGAATDTSVTWALREPSGCGSVDGAGVYTAPAVGATCHVVATSVVDPAASAEAVASVAPPPSTEPSQPTSTVAVTVTPSSGAVDGCRSLTFTANVSGTTNRSVTWSVQEGSAGGSITSSGVYTAPPSAGTYHVLATSQASPTTRAAVAVTVSDRILGVAVSPSTVSLAPGATAQFTANVTTTCGSFSSTQTVTAPN